MLCAPQNGAVVTLTTDDMQSSNAAHACHVLLLCVPSTCLQRWNQRLITLEDGKLLISKDALVSHVLMQV